MLYQIFSVLYFMLPAYFSNMAPVLFKDSWPSLAKPIDGGRTFRGKRIFGDHKTWRGIVVGILTGTCAFGIQKLFYEANLLHSISLLNYYDAPLLTGFLLASGAIIGDAIKSFFKRQLGKKEGERWIPFDQLDFVVGALVFASLFFIPSLLQIVIILLISFLGHILVDHCAYWLGMRETKW